MKSLALRFSEYFRVSRVLNAAKKSLLETPAKAGTADAL